MKQIVRLTEEDLHRLIEDCVKHTLNELATPRLWHFTYIPQLFMILRDNKFKLTRSHPNHNKQQGITGYSPKRPYYMCATRSKSSFEGYSHLVSNDNLEGYVRIQLDGNALNSIAHVKASDYFGTRYDADEIDLPYGKRAMYKSIENGEFMHHGLTLRQAYINSEDNESNEREDTIWYRKEFIPSANKYIERIDVLLKQTEDEPFRKFKYIDVINQIKEQANKLNIPIFFYQTKEDFDKQGTGVKI